MDLDVTFNIPGVPSLICSTYNVVLGRGEWDGGRDDRKKGKKGLVSNKYMQMYLSEAIQVSYILSSLLLSSATVIPLPSPSKQKGAHKLPRAGCTCKRHANVQHNSGKF